jgi:hypothetical protein
MRTQHLSITNPFLFRLAQAILPEAILLSLFGRRVRVTADRVRRR